MVKYLKIMLFIVFAFNLLACSILGENKVETETSKRVKILYSDVEPKDSEAKATLSAVSVSDEGYYGIVLFKYLDKDSPYLFSSYSHEYTRDNTLKLPIPENNRFLTQVNIIPEQVFLFNPVAIGRVYEGFWRGNRDYYCKFNNYVFGFIPERDNDYILEVGIASEQKCIVKVSKIDKRTKQFIPVEIKSYGYLYAKKNEL